MDATQLAEIIDWDELSEKMMCNWSGGQLLDIYADGTLIVRDYNCYPCNPTEEPIATLKTMGVDTIDMDYFCTDYAKLCDDGIYREVDTNREIGSAIEVIRECIRDGEMEPFIKCWMDEITQSILEKEYFNKEQ